MVKFVSDPFFFQIFKRRLGIENLFPVKNQWLIRMMLEEILFEFFHFRVHNILNMLKIKDHSCKAEKTVVIIVAASKIRIAYFVNV